MEFKHTKCNICGSDRTRPIGKRKSPDGRHGLETNIVQCNNCGLMYPDPMPYPDKEEVQKNFKDHGTYFSEAVTGKRLKKYERIMEIIENKKPQKGKLLDIGCGRGELAYIASKRNWDAVGLEVSEAFAAYARDKFNIKIMTGDLNSAGLQENSFDVVCLNSVIQYVQDPIALLKKINLLLKKEGILYIEVTNDAALIFRAGDFFMSVKSGEKITTRLSPLFPSFQIYGFSKKTIIKAFDIANLELLWLTIKGAHGGGNVMRKGKSGALALINAIRKIVIFVGGITGNGHLIYCLARKA